ncbi:protein kinase [Acidobacteriota bacterium]
MKCPKCQLDNPDDSKFCKECGTNITSVEEARPSFTKTIETPKEELTTGSTFAGRYQIIEELGKGGMGKVYKAVDTRINEKIALKLIRPEIASDKKTLERFGNELKLARKITHKNVGKMFDINEEQGTHYITMEYVSGQDLKGLIRQTGQLTVGKAVSIAKQICDGLSEAHSLGVVHRDLKPNNIMIDRGGNARIMDFGIARAVKGKSITGSGVMIGTPQYMSPEQVEGKEVDQRSDIYSLGIILYEMLTDRVPFEGDTPLTVGVKQKTEIPKDPRGFNERIQEDLNRLILKCLDKERKNRYQSADELRSELERLEQGLPTTDRVASKKRPLTSKEITVSFSPKKLFIPLAVVFAVLITALIILKPWSGDRTIPVPTDRPSIAVLPFENNTGEEKKDQLRDSLSDQLTADLYQSKYLHVKSASHVYGILKGLNLLQAEKFTLEDLRAIANLGGASHLLTGSYSEDRDTFLITVFINRMDSAQDAPSFTVEGPSTGKISALVDDITRRIKAELNLTQIQIAGDLDREVARITSSSPEALKLYSEARRKQYEADFPGAIELYEKTLAIDPEFAMAIRGMAVSYWNIGAYPAKSLSLLQKALDLGERLSERERLQIKGDLDSASGRPDEAVAAFTELLKLHPEDSLAHSSLGLAYQRMRKIDEEIESLKRAIQYKSEFTGSYIRLANIYRSQGLDDKADETIKMYVDNFGDHAYIHRHLAGQFRLQQDYDLALSEINKALSLNPALPSAILGKGEIHFDMGDLVGAEKEYQKLLQEKEVAYYSRGLMRLSDLYFFQGKFKASKEKVIEGIKWAEKAGEIGWVSNWYIASAHNEFASGNFGQALREVDRALDYAGVHNRSYDQSYCLLLRGLIYLGMGSMDSSQETAADLKQFAEQSDLADTSDFSFLLGSIELERGNYSQAISFFEKALVENEESILYLYSTVLAYYGEGDLEKAQKDCEKILSPMSYPYGIGYPGYFDLYAKSYFILGKIYEKKGWPGKAIEHYEKFLDLWKDSHPGLPEVADARERVAELRQ